MKTKRYECYIGINFALPVAHNAFIIVSDVTQKEYHTSFVQFHVIGLDYRDDKSVIMVARALLLLLGSIIGLSSAKLNFDICTREPIPINSFTQGTRRTTPKVNVTVIGGNNYLGGQTKQVSVDIISGSGHDIVGVIMQMAVRSASDTRRGSWSVVEYSNVSVARCVTDGDTVVTRQQLDHIEVTWTAPPASANSDEVLEFLLTMVSDSNMYWKIIAAEMFEVDVHNVANGISRETPDDDDEEEEQGNPGEQPVTGATEDPNEAERREEEERSESLDRDMENLHDTSLEVKLMIEDQQRRQQLDLEEDLGSEGAWTEEMEAERRRELEERRAEETRYEITLQKEEMERLERLRQEIRDKEEWDRDHPPAPDAVPTERQLTNPPGKNPDNRENVIDFEDDGTELDINGATTTVSMFSATALTFLTCFLLL